MGYLRGMAGNWEIGSGVYERHIKMIKNFWGYRHGVMMRRGCGGPAGGGLIGGQVGGDGVIFYKYLLCVW